MRKAGQLGAKSERERDYIETLLAFYSGDQKTMAQLFRHVLNHHGNPASTPSTFSGEIATSASCRKSNAKQLLLDVLGENDIELPVLYSENLVGDGQTMFEHAANLNWEGIITKRPDTPYRSERNENWLKIKAVHKGKFPVVGFVKDPTGVAALYLGKREGKDLVYMGKVGTGWSRTVSSQIRKQLDKVVSPKSKLTKTIRKPKATWVKPKFFADVEYRDITSDGLLRASSFKGLSQDKS